MNDHYFSESPSTEPNELYFEINVWGHRLKMKSSAGVFSTRGLDKATEIFLAKSPPPTGAKNVLDLGCGWGAIACAIAAASPQTRVIAVDINERARELTKQNAAANNLKVEVYSPEEVPTDIIFDQIWSNPPIRIGKIPLRELLTTWFKRTNGTARLVVSKNLGADSLQNWLTENGWPTRRITSVKGFRILESSIQLTQ